MLAALAEAIGSYTEAQGGPSPFATAIPGFTLLRSDHVRPPGLILHKPALCMVVQGAKWAVFGERLLEYRAGQALVVSLEMPALGRVVQASPEAPYLGLVIEFDLPLMREVMALLDPPPRAGGDPARGAFVADCAGPVVDCALRLVRLLATPRAIPALHPAIMRELSYWLLAGPQGAEIARHVLATVHAAPMVRVLHVLRERFREPIPIGQLAREAGMSPSALHRQFKAMTAMTPLNYQKQLRLLEARNLMVADGLAAEAAAYQVGYQSASQFSREYARLFGMPPRRDATSLRWTEQGSANSPLVTVGG